MNLFDEIREKVTANLSDWVKINDPKSKWTIEDFTYDTGVDENLTRPHCWRCVTVNQCWFVDKEGKKPQEFDYLKYSFVDIPPVKRGLYHPNCHDEKIKIPTPKEKDITLVLPQGKIDYLFKEKAHIYNAMGYHSNEEIMYAYKLTKKLLKISFANSQYLIRNHDEKGVKITLYILESPGINEDVGKIYKLKTGWTIFPNGKIKANTIIGGFIK